MKKARISKSEIIENTTNFLRMNIQILSMVVYVKWLRLDNKQLGARINNYFSAK